MTTGGESPKLDVRPDGEMSRRAQDDSCSENSQRSEEDRDHMFRIFTGASTASVGSTSSANSNLASRRGMQTVTRIRSPTRALATQLNSHHYKMALEAEGYEVAQIIGRSTNNLGYKVVSGTKDGLHYAVKVTQERESDGVLCETLRREYELLSTINHPSIAKAVNFIRGNFGGAFVMEFCGGFRLDKIIRSTNFDFEERAHVLETIIDGVSYLHGMQVGHRDLQGENILVDIRQGDVVSVKLVDFGSACRESDLKVFLDEGINKRITPESRDPDRESIFTYDVFAVGLLAIGLFIMRLTLGSDVCHNGELELPTSKHLPDGRLTAIATTYFNDLLNLDPTKRFRIDQAQRALPKVDQWLVSTRISL